VRLAGSPTSRGVSSMALVPPLAGGGPGRVGRGPSVETLVDLLFQNIRHFGYYKISQQNGVSLERLRGHGGTHRAYSSLFLVPIDTLLI
jgi:hypothetical protein